jgi:hypothetical protein
MQEPTSGFLFDLKLLCGSYAYFSTMTIWEKSSKDGREFRKPSLVKFSIQNKLNSLGQKSRVVTNAHELKVWLYQKGWAIVPDKVAFSLMPQWLQSKECITSPIGIFTDVEITSQLALCRSARGVKRNYIIQRDKKSCVLCGDTEQLTMQHVIPYSRGGESTTRNLVTLCNKCNQDLGAEYMPDLYELVQLHHGYDPSLITNPLAELDDVRWASFLSNNLMQTRCEVW